MEIGKLLNLLRKVFGASLRHLPSHYEWLDPNRCTLSYFCVSGLDIIGDKSMLLESRDDLIDWVYSLQCPSGGFRASPFFVYPTKHENDIPHLAMTYSALCMLVILGDDLSRVKRPIDFFQGQDGSVCGYGLNTESDIRYMFCACATCTFLNDWSGLNIEKALEFVDSCQNYDGAYGQRPGSESHGGSTYCAVASLHLLGRRPNREDDLLLWLTLRQKSGFQGRPHKDPDACYSFWIGGTLQILGRFDVCVDKDVLLEFIMNCVDKYGGIGKTPDCRADLLHSYFGLCGISLTGLVGDSVNGLCPSLGISSRANSLRK